jgi:hypothetical protein
MAGESTRGQTPDSLQGHELRHVVTAERQPATRSRRGSPLGVGLRGLVGPHAQ